MSARLTALARRAGDWRGWLLPLALLGLWEVLSRQSAMHAYAMPPLAEIGRALREVIANGELLSSFAGSLQRTSLGLGLGIAAGIAAGLAIALSRLADLLASPLLHSLRQVPLLGLAPLISLWIGNGEEAKVFVIALASFYPVVLNTAGSLSQVPPHYQEVGRSLGFGRWQQFRHVQWPAALPGVLSGIGQAVPFAWIAAIGSELLFNAGAGFGNLMMTAELGARMDIIIVCAITVTALGVVMSHGVHRLAQALLRSRTA